jgi:hypothetical protein
VSINPHFVEGREGESRQGGSSGGKRVIERASGAAFAVGGVRLRRGECSRRRRDQGLSNYITFPASTLQGFADGGSGLKVTVGAAHRAAAGCDLPFVRLRIAFTRRTVRRH